MVANRASLALQLAMSWLALTCLISGLDQAAAQTYPSRPLTLLVPLAPGGPLDTQARILAERMRTYLGEPVIVENVTGAAGTVGTGRLARSSPDGYTIGIGFTGTHVLNGAIYSLPYDVVKDFDPIAMTSINPHVIITRATMPAKNLGELIVWLKANQDKATGGSAGTGSSTQVGAVLFQNVIGAKFPIIPYRGSAPALADVMAGQIDLMVDVASDCLQYLPSGKLKAYAVTAATRLASAPDIPTVGEAGLPGFYMSTWYGIWGPKGLPKAIYAKLNAAVVEALADPTVRHRYADLGLDIPPHEQQTPEALLAFQQAEIAKWWPIIKAAGIKPE
jgi:tripartite-type tricarboxylate transporter receptor subunit TctC